MRTISRSFFGLVATAAAVIGLTAAPGAATTASTAETTPASTPSTASMVTTPLDTTPQTTEVPDTASSAGTMPTEQSTPGANTDWEAVDTPDSCMCSDGSPFKFFVHPGATDKVLFYLSGGGACFNKDLCGPQGTTYKRTLSGDDPPALNGDLGIFDLSKENNPFRDYTIVFVPYCTGDVHLGNRTNDYGDGVVIRHNGYLNGNVALSYVAARFPDASKFVVAGSSAGSIPTPLYAGLAQDMLPDAEVIAISDASGAYPDAPVLNLEFGNVWGTGNAIPAWPENDGMTVDRWSFPGMFIQAHKHAPKIKFAKVDTAFDEVQIGFTLLAGLPADNLVGTIDANEAQEEAGGGPTISSYVAPGSMHTVLGRPEVYTWTVNGVSFVDWLTQVVDGQQPADVHCTVCAQ